MIRIFSFFFSKSRISLLASSGFYKVYGTFVQRMNGKISKRPRSGKFVYVKS